ncbi:MAG: phosphotransferase, partial [Planctomycetaceae bacterium]|nr:phosphotransferase [Planctomycetaceae bacterium]
MPTAADDHTGDSAAARRLAQSLLQPDLWVVDSHQPGTAAQLMETHISRIILTGNSAFKLRKPVNPGFADFSTLAKRKFDCEEELRLNRRLSPHLYLGIIPITGTPEQPEIDGDGPPIEYAVHMRRFPQEALLLRVCEEGRLQPHHIDRLAEELADFHLSIPPAPVDSTLGTPADVLAAARGNFEHLQPVLQSLSESLASQPAERSDGLSLAQVDQTKGTIDELQQLTEETFQQLEPLFRLRREQGWIRECHGDLHLQNMLLEDDRVVIFDCVEFNEEFRWIDILSDVCFAVMDLVANGHPALGWRLLDRWVERTDSYSALPAARFYLVYRAMVRAKVAGIRLQNALEELAQGEQVELNADWEELARYVRLAREFTSVYLPALILTYGVSGSGKTTLTSPLVEQLPAI